ncbi:MAG TPA: aminotransferase class V-fold PLP-dependent enzyme [Cyclobacteriaceae bacterium]|nr:aminotransferase class V-fold PLP-dependent enzyme [Cyclobacteriaceae bacterium]
MISFYPGPSRVYDDIPLYVKEAHKLGILGISHRSEAFMGISKKTISLLKEKLNIPASYTVFFVSSATECWEIIAQSLHSTLSYHIYNGDFGKRWYAYTHKIKTDTVAISFALEEEPDAKDYIFKDAHALICLTQNETSNGTQLNNTFIRQIRKNNPLHLIAVDATSSMAGFKLDFKSADIWFASVQKCFGLPAGMGIMVCSKNALARAKSIGEQNHYNSLSLMIDKMQHWQTTYTPNVMNIYLLMRVMEAYPGIEKVHQQILERYHSWISFFTDAKQFKLLIQNDALRSRTVICLSSSEKNIKAIKHAAAKAGFLLGDGYGKLKSTTIRIANFPALKDKEIARLKKVMASYI